MDNYGQALLIDLVTVLSCIGLLLRFGDLRFSHPATPYIVFHVHTVTSRLGGLMNGATALYGNAPGWFEPVRPEEIVRAALYCDLAFWSVTAVWIFVKASPRRESVSGAEVMRLDPMILRPVLLVSFLVGIVGLRVAAVIPGIPTYEGIDPSSPWSTSSYLLILPAWFGLAVLGHIYYYGFGRLTGFLLAVYLMLMSIQGGMRARVVIGLILAVQIWVEHRNRRWPSRSMMLALAGVGVLFFPMKTIGVMAQKGESLSQMSTAIVDSVTEVSEGSATDQMFLDEFAIALTLLDIQGVKYFGSIYLPLLTLPIPRALWPEKPVIAGYITDISTRYRPMGTSGMITTYLGESYANFGLAGIFLVPPLLAAFLAFFHRKAHEVPHDSVRRFSYVLLSVNLIQVYRDGLLSIFMFAFVNMLPLAVIVVAHIGLSFIRKRRRVAQQGHSDTNPQTGEGTTPPPLIGSTGSVPGQAP